MKHKLRNFMWTISGIILMAVIVFATTNINDLGVTTINISATNITASKFFGDGSSLTGIPIFNSTYHSKADYQFAYNNFSGNGSFTTSSKIITQNLGIGDGNVVNPSLRFTTDTGTGFYRAAESSIGISSDTSLRMLINNIVTIYGDLSLDENDLTHVDKLCNASLNCFTLSELNRTMGDGSYNVTYNNLLNQSCPTGKVINGTLTNGTFICMTPIAIETDPVWTGNYTIFTGLINNASYLSTFNTTYHNYVIANSTNRSENWDNMNTINTTQMQDNGGILNILESWLTTFVNSVSGIIRGVWTENNANNLLISNGTAIGYNETILNNSIRNVGNTNFYNKSANINTGNYNISIASINSRFCLNGVTCTKYIYYNGSDTIIQG